MRFLNLGRIQFPFCSAFHRSFSQSYAKNMDLYGQRVGCLSLVCEDEKQVVVVKSQLQQLARPMYNNPPVHGALIVSTVLGDPDLKQLWLKKVKGMAGRIIGMRSALRENIEIREWCTGNYLKQSTVLRPDLQLLLRLESRTTPTSVFTTTKAEQFRVYVGE